MKMRLLELMKLRGITQKQLGEILWPDSDSESRRQLTRRLVSGEARLKVEWIGQICEVLNVTPNELFYE